MSTCSLISPQTSFLDWDPDCDIETWEDENEDRCARCGALGGFNLKCATCGLKIIHRTEFMRRFIDQLKHDPTLTPDADMIKRVHYFLTANNMEITLENTREALKML